MAAEPTYNPQFIVVSFDCGKKAIKLNKTIELKATAAAATKANSNHWLAVSFACTPPITHLHSWIGVSKFKATNVEINSIVEKIDYNNSVKDIYLIKLK